MAVVALGVASFACGGGDKTVVYDLARRVGIADRWSAREVILFGTAAAEPHQVDGFHREAATPAGDAFTWTKGHAELSLSFAQAAPRAAVVDLAPYGGVRGQAAEVSLNGRPVARLTLNDGRHRYRVPLPADAQRPGDNRLRFEFAATASPSDSPGNPDRRQLAAAFYGLTVGLAGDAGLEDLLARDAPRPFAVVEQQGGVPALVQMAPSVVRYALELPAGAELRFTPRLHSAARAAGTPVALRVTVEARAGEEKEVWTAVVDPRAAAAEDEVRVGLPGGAGDVVRVGLHAGAADGARFAWAVWTAPRVMGRGAAAANPLDPAPFTADEQERAAGLRRSLQGMNVLLIVLDAARAGSFGVYGYGRATTPEVDRMAAEGVVFERASTPAVYTLGAMSSLWTSQYPDRHHAEVSYADRLPADRLTLAQALTEAGVHAAGFIANPMAGRLFGFERGFAEFEQVYERFPDLGSRGEAFRRVVPEWLRRNASRRFFAYVHLREPHFPYDPGPPFDTRFGPDAPLGRAERRDKTWYTDVNQGRVRPTPEQVAHLQRLYDGNLAYADREVGELRRALEQAGLWDRTVVIVTADHGEQLYEHGYISHSAQVYEQSTRVPLIVRFPPAGAPRGRRVSAQVDLQDVAPTVLDVFGVASGRAAEAFAGRSLLPVAAGAPGRHAVVSRTVWERPVYGLRDGRFKYIHDTRTGAEQLYDLGEDPGEQDPLQSREPLRAAFYRQALHDWMARLKRPETRPAAASGGAAPSAQTCEHLRTLGYLDARCR
ncbi:MAG TPA: sulfatase-like hydrolase/transferase [Vicinamibacteria bacterium]